MRILKQITFILLLSGLALGQANPVPFVNQPLVPMAVTPGSQGFTLTVNGTGFVSGSAVNWNGTPLATTFVSSSQLTAAVPAANVAAQGTAWVTVANPSPGGGSSQPLYFGVTFALPSANFTSLAPSAAGTAYYMIAADFNGDGKLDLAEAGTNGLAIQLGNGDGTFQAPVTYDAGVCLSAPVVGDFNGDGKLDILILGAQLGVCLTGVPGFSIFPGNGDGTFQAPMTVTISDYPIGVAIGDFNRDGKLDVALACSTEFGTSGTCNSIGNNIIGTIAIYLGNGDGTFQNEVDYVPTAWIPGYPPPGGLTSAFLTIGDFNHDGTLDIAFSPRGEQLLEGNGDGTFVFVNTVNSINGYNVAADLNGDGKLDLFSFPNDTFLGNGDDTFQSPISSEGLPGCSYASGCFLGDGNGDGILDAISAGNTMTGTLVSFSLGNGDGTFQPNGGSITGTGTTAVAVGDFNRDGMIDVAVVSSGAPQLTVWLQNLIPTLYLFPSSLTFKMQTVGTTSPPQTVRLTNHATSAVSISSIATDQTDFGETNDCGPSLAVMASCMVSATFSPSQVETLTGKLAVNYSLNGQPATQAVSLTGSTPTPMVTLAPLSLAFPVQYVGASSPPMTVTLTNTGLATLAISSVATGGNFTQTNTCGSTLAVNASCTISVTFAPTDSGLRQNFLTIASNAVGGQSMVPLSGTGMDFELSSIAPTSLTVTPGQAENYTANVLGLSPFSGTVSLTCSGVPQATCTVMPSSVTLSSNSESGNVQVAVITAAPMSAFIHFAHGKVALAFVMLGGVLGFVGLGGSKARREINTRLLGAIFMFCLISVVLTMPGCGGSSGGGSGGGGGGTPTGTYTVSVTGTFSSGSSKLSHSTDFTLIVQ